MLTFQPGMPVQFNTKKLKKRPDLKDKTGIIIDHNGTGGRLRVCVEATGELVHVKKENVLVPCFNPPSSLLDGASPETTEKAKAILAADTDNPLAQRVLARMNDQMS